MSGPFHFAPPGLRAAMVVCACATSTFASADASSRTVSAEPCGDVCQLEVLGDEPGDAVESTDLPPPERRKACSPLSLVEFNGVVTPLIRGLQAEVIFWNLDKAPNVVRRDRGVNRRFVYATGALCYGFGTRRVERRGSSSRVTFPYACLTAVPEASLPRVLQGFADDMIRGNLTAVTCGSSNGGGQ